MEEIKKTRVDHCNANWVNEFERNKIWDLVERPHDRNYLNYMGLSKKLNVDGEIIRNKARSVVQGYNQEERIAHDKLLHPLLD